MLGEALPDLGSSSPGDVQCEALPALRYFVVANNMTDASSYGREVMDTKYVVDWRETLVWREDGVEERRVRACANELRSDDVINLQFTRCVGRVDDRMDVTLVDVSGTTGAPKAASVRAVPVFSVYICGSKSM